MQVAVIGNNANGCTEDQWLFAERLGNALSKANYTLICGGLGGVMEAVCKGVKSAADSASITVGILPGEKAEAANRFIDIIIPTGFGIARNKLVINSGEAVIAIGGGSGTLSEIAFAWQLDKPVCAVKNFDGWSAKLSGQQLDEKRKDAIVGVETVEEVMTWLSEIREQIS